MKLKMKKKEFMFLRKSNRILFLILLLLFPLFIFSQAHQTQSFHLKKQNLSRALKTIGKIYHTSFAYDTELIKGNKIQGSFHQLNLENTLIKIFRSSNISFEIIDKQVILFPKTKAFEKKYSQTIKGKILDSLSNNAMPLSHIQIKNYSTGMVSDKNGQFVFKAVFTPDDSIVFSYIGYKTRTISVNDLQKTQTAIIRLSFQENLVNQLEVFGSKPPGIGLNYLDRSSVLKVDFKELDDIGGMVEKDVLSVSQIFPGISTSNESASEINIRGGLPGQNLILYDHINLYHYGHFFGKISAINPLFVDQMIIRKEAYKPENSGRISGIIEIKSTNTILEKTRAKANINLLSAGAYFSHSMFKNKLSVSFGFRSSINRFFSNYFYDSYYDQIFQNSKVTVDQEVIILDSMQSYSVVEPKHYFYDLNAKVVFKPNPDNEITLSGIYISDNLNYKFIDDKDDSLYETDSINVFNRGLSLNWEKRWTRNWSSQIVSSWSNFANYYEYKDQDEADTLFFHQTNYNKITDINTRISATKKLKQQTIKFGYIFNYLSQDVQINLLRGALNSDSLTNKASAITHSAFIDHESNLFTWLDTYAAIRYFNYQLNSNLYLEPRFSIKLKPHAFHLHYKLAAGLYYQTINQIYYNNSLNVEDYLWVLGREDENENDEYFSVTKNFQYSFSILFNKKNWIFETTFFHKDISNLPSRVMSSDIYNPYTTTDVKVNGIENSVSISSKYSFTMVSYSYIHSLYDIDDQISLIPTDYDIPHQLKVLQIFKIKDYSLSINYNLHSGRAYSKIQSIETEEINNGDISYNISYESFNTERLKNYQRLDLSLSYKFAYKTVNGKVILSIINAMNTKNILSLNYDIQYPNPDYQQELKIIEQKRIGLPRLFNIGVQVGINNIQ